MDGSSQKTEENADKAILTIIVAEPIPITKKEVAINEMWRILKLGQKPQIDDNVDSNEETTGHDSKEEKSVCEHCEDVGHIKKDCLLNPASNLFKRMLKQHYLITIEMSGEKEVASLQDKVVEIKEVPQNPAIFKIEEIVEIQGEFDDKINRIEEKTEIKLILCNQCWTYGCIVKGCIAQKYRNAEGSWKKSTPYYIKPKINYWDEETSDEETSDEESGDETDKRDDAIPLTQPLSESGIKITFVAEPVENTDNLELLQTPSTPFFVPLIDRSGSDRHKEEKVVSIKEQEPIIKLIHYQSSLQNKGRGEK